MAARVRHFTLVGVSVLIVAATVTWQLAAELDRHHLDYMRSRVTEQLAALRVAVTASDRQILNGLISAYEDEASARHNSGRTDRSLALTKRFEDSKALLMSQLQLVSGTWSTSWTSTTKEAAGWPANFVKELLPNLPLGRIKAGALDWSRVELPGGRIGWATLTAVDVKVAEKTESFLLLSILPLAALADLVDASVGEAFVVDDKGYALSWPEAKYLGARIDNDERVQRSLKGAFKGDGPFTSLDGRFLWSGFEKVPGSNLTIGYSVPMARNWSLVLNLMGQSLLALVGLILLLGFGFVWLTQRYVNGYEFMRRSILNLASGAPIGQPQQVFREVVDIKGVLDAIDLKKSMGGQLPEPIASDGAMAGDEVYRQIVDGIGRALKGPLATVLGHAQLARAKSEGEEDLKTHYTVIEREARLAREVVENLTKMVQSERPQLKKTEVSDLVLISLANLKDRIQEVGLTPKKELTPQVYVWADADQMRRTIETLISALCKAKEMGGENQGELRVSTRKEADRVKLEIKATGLSVDVADLGQMFQPLSPAQMKYSADGMSLTSALGMVEGQKGRLHCDQPSEGGLAFTLELVSGSRETTVSVVDERPAIVEPEIQAVPEISTGAKSASVDAWVEQEARKIDLAVEAARATVNDLKQTMVIDGEPEAIDVSPVPESQDAYPKVSVAELAGKRPLTGSKMGGLPTPPAFDELTLIGLDSGALGASGGGGVEELSPPAPPLPVRVRKPIVRIKN